MPTAGDQGVKVRSEHGAERDRLKQRVRMAIAVAKELNRELEWRVAELKAVIEQGRRLVREARRACGSKRGGGFPRKRRRSGRR